MHMSQYGFHAGWLSGDLVRLMAWWFKFDSQRRQTFFQAYFHLSPLQKHVRKVVGGFGKKKLCQCWCEKARKHMCVTDCHDMTLAVKVALNSNTTNIIRALIVGYVSAGE